MHLQAQYQRSKWSLNSTSICQETENDGRGREEVFINWKGIWQIEHKNMVISKLGVKINVKLVQSESRWGTYYNWHCKAQTIYNYNKLLTCQCLDSAWPAYSDLPWELLTSEGFPIHQAKILLHSETNEDQWGSQDLQSLLEGLLTGSQKYPGKPVSSGCQSPVTC